MPRKRKAAPGKEAALEEQQRTDILADDAKASKQENFGACLCGARISGNVVTLRCPTCSAWRRWRSAFRIAAQALRGPQS
ncbi:MAG: hypothetical protein ROZ64_16580 [Burkholderiaceae bacterium]|jgi:hypothetical protein|nr:hypothetical protein [Burkholderiaceae bacterium]